MRPPTGQITLAGGAGLLALALAIAGCGHASPAATVKRPPPAAPREVIRSAGKHESCREAQELVKRQNRHIEQHDREVRAGTLAAAHLPLEIVKLCLAPERHPPRFETLAAVERQLAAGQVRSALIVKRVRRLHITLDSGRTAAVEYARHQEALVVSELKHAGVAITIE